MIGFVRQSFVGIGKVFYSKILCGFSIGCHFRHCICNRSSSKCRIDSVLSRAGRSAAMSFGFKPVNISTLVQATRCGAPGAAELLMSEMEKAVTDGVPGAVEFLEELQQEGLFHKRGEASDAGVEVDADAVANHNDERAHKEDEQGQEERPVCVQ